MCAGFWRASELSKTGWEWRRRPVTHSLPIFIRLSSRHVVLTGEGEAAEAKRRLLERAGAILVGEHDPQARIAIVADGDEAVAARLKARGLLVNVVDRPALCDFTMPAIVDREPVLIAVATGGASAGLAKALRQRIEALLPANLGLLAAALAGARAAIRERWPDPADRRRAIDDALAPGGPLDPLGPGDVASWLRDAAAGPAGGIVPIRLRSADPDDLTLRAARLLSQADRIYHRFDIPAAILDRGRADAARLACAAPPADPPPGLSLDLDWEGA